MENKKDTSLRSNFGAWGWFIIVFSFLSFMFAGNLIVDSLNITVGAFSALHGWKTGTLLTYSTVAGLIAIAGAGVLSKCVQRFGVKKIYIISLAVVSACCMVWGSITTTTEYAIIIILVNVFGEGFGFVGGTAILANWFPKKKGLAMGWATIGFQASAIVLLPLYVYILNRYNLVVAYRAIGTCLLILLVVCILFLKNNPEERGCTPDNEHEYSVEEYKEMHEKAQEIGKEYYLTNSQLLRTKQIWQIGVINGLVQLAITILIVQFIPNLMVCGFSETRATLLYSLASIVGGIGSYLWGVLDQKIGIKKATMWMCVAHSVAGLTFALASMQIGGKVMAAISAFIVGTILGVSSNYVGSFTAQVFGRYGYASAFSLVIMIVTGLRSLGYSLVGVINTATNSNMIAYMIAAVLGVVALLMTTRVDDSCIDPVANRMNEMKEAECM